MDKIRVALINMFQFYSNIAIVVANEEQAQAMVPIA